MAGANTTTIELLKKYNFPIQKKYGQNFLVDDNILEGIVRAAQVSETDTILEIGPGLGALTGVLCRAADQGRVIAVEVDKLLIPILKESLGEYENLTVINEDILKVDLSELLSEEDGVAREKARVVANLPYYITTPVILELLDKSRFIKSITVMVQKEVAERMQEGPGSKSYGALSLAVQYYALPNYIMTVSRNCFLPRPDVDSAVIRLDLYEEEDRPVKPKDPEKMFRIIRAAFNQRRKTLANAVSHDASLGFSREEIVSALGEMELSETIRGEALTLDQFSRLSDLLGTL